MNTDEIKEKKLSWGGGKLKEIFGEESKGS